MPAHVLTSTDILNQSGERLDYSFHEGSKSDRLVILGHGVTGNKDRPLLVALAERLSALGWPCLRISYSGNGASEGKFEDSTITKGISDLSAILSVVRSDIKIAYTGHSMGAAVGILRAQDDKRIAVLVSLAGMTFTRAFAAREFGGVVPGSGVMWDDPDCPLSQKFIDDLTNIDNTLPAAARIRQPWLLVHGTEDDVVPPQDGLAAFEAASCEKAWLPVAGAGHGFGDEYYDVIAAKMDDWFKKYL